MKITYLNKKLASLALAGTLFLLPGCDSVELSENLDDYDIIDTNSEESKNGLYKGVKQELDVDGENFKLIVEYHCENDEWRITSDKKLYMKIYTKGLDDTKKVYIDNIHMDTFIISSNAYFNGIKQDTLDDRIHTSLLMGFPISDTNEYYGINEIEGQNDEFIHGYFYGFSGYSSGEVEEERRLESDYLEDGVYGNKISGVIGILIEDTLTGEIRGVDVDTKLRVDANNKITFQENNTEITYEYDKKGNKKVLSKKPIK